ncbi:hypothetical protein CGLO_15281 [Colletotrichum gloeosporioides Cg-14]|uniref:Uncharacterized protein n=1 Tax=Colletotrichum gloeosporioides (strain Cg-14) TaxID=1237896 RepID=T0K253_COLGC|nr:hypothetical protein CGLO_15281 [Colletotrichum gloeosporioides Cg-14]
MDPDLLSGAEANFITP